MNDNIPAGYNADGEFVGFPDRGIGPKNWWARIPPAERTERMRALAIKREAAKTPEARKAASHKAITARWAKKKSTNP